MSLIYVNNWINGYKRTALSQSRILINKSSKNDGNRRSFLGKHHTDNCGRIINRY